jgi:glycosyltransferase involved in cell wall biosynthesis
VLLEAMALEVPVVATRIAGVPRLIEDGGNGLLVGPGDEAGLAAGLSRVLTEPALAERFRRAGRATIVERYSFAARMEKVRSLYDGMGLRG